MARSVRQSVLVVVALAYGVAAILGQGLHSHDHCQDDRVEAVAVHDCGCGHCHESAPAAPVASPAADQADDAAQCSAQRSDCSGDCAVCAALAAVRLGLQVDADDHGPASLLVPAFVAVDSLDVPHVVFSTDARGPPVA